METQIASDIIRNGLGIELIDDKGHTVAEVFRCDQDMRVSVSVFNDKIFLEDLKLLLN